MTTGLAVLVFSAASGAMLSGTALVTAITVAVGLVMVVLALCAPRAVVLGTLIALPFVGLLRRATGSYVATLDPILIIPPMLAAVCLFASVRRGDRAPRSRLGDAVAGFLALGALGALNPTQGGLKVGIVGAGLFVGPLIWFFVGQRLADLVTLRRLLRLLACIALIVAAYGLKQMIFGFSSFEQRWIDSKLSVYSALSINGKIRPFSTFASAAEYSYFLVIGAVLFATRLRAERWITSSAPVILFVTACFFAGSRGIFVFCSSGVILVLIASRVKHLALSLLICLACSFVGLSLLKLVPLSRGTSVAAATQNRTLEGLTDPFNDSVSTANLHTASIASGTINGLKNPVGSGAGATNQAGYLFGGRNQSSEHDVPNVLLAYGWLGGLCLGLLILNVYRLARRAVASGRAELIGPAVLFLALFGSWFNGAMYAVTALAWFLLGAIEQELFRHEIDHKVPGVTDSRG